MAIRVTLQQILEGQTFQDYVYIEVFVLACLEENIYLITDWTHDAKMDTMGWEEMISGSCQALLNPIYQNSLIQFDYAFLIDSLKKHSYGRSLM